MAIFSCAFVSQKKDNAKLSCERKKIGKEAGNHLRSFLLNDKLGRKIAR
jgi:hypothetical protein